jgi:hypothetical protein
VPLVIGSHSALVFTRLQFLGQDWTRYSGVSEIIYTPNTDQELVVVTEGEAGVYTTFWFRVKAGDDVWVINKVIHIPAICLRSAAGDESKCQKGREKEPRERERAPRISEPVDEEEEEEKESPVTPPPAPTRRKVRRKPQGGTRRGARAESL